MDEAKFHSAALEFCGFEAELTCIRKQGKRCTEYEKPDYYTGYPGNPACTDEAPLEDKCEACAERELLLPYRHQAVKGRRLARAKMIRWYQKLTASEDLDKTAEAPQD